MDLSTTRLVLASDAAIDLHLHTTYSDGTWTPEQLLDHLASEAFGLVAIADHDRVETVMPLPTTLEPERLGSLVRSGHDSSAGA